MPAGKILVHDDTHVYGYGRQPRYFRWTVPMEFHLFAAPRAGTTTERKPRKQEPGSIIRVDKSKSLNPANTALAVAAWVKAEQPDGVVVARGGGILGYSLYIQGGIPRFGVSANSKRAGVSATQKVTGDWVHLAGVLTADAQIQVYVNGALAGTAAAPGLIPRDPADSMQIGADEGSAVAAYEGGLPFKGSIDEVRVYHGVLPAAAVRRLAAGEKVEAEKASLVLHYRFEKGNATDASGNQNRGKVVGAISVAGKAGKGMRFSGRLPDADANPDGPSYAWTTQIPVLVRGMVLAGRTLFVAGPDDLLDEPRALQALDEPDTQAKLHDQDAALLGAAGGVLRAVAAADGATLSELRLSTIPVWDGLAAAGGRLYLAGADGTLRCYAGK